MVGHYSNLGTLAIHVAKFMGALPMTKIKDVESVKAMQPKVMILLLLTTLNWRINFMNFSANLIRRKHQKWVLLHDALYIPKLACNSLSTGKLTLHNLVNANFQSNGCTFEDMRSGRMIGRCECDGDVHYFQTWLANVKTTSCIRTLSSASFVSESIINEINLLHSRESHPSMVYY